MDFRDYQNVVGTEVLRDPQTQ